MNIQQVHVDRSDIRNLSSREFSQPNLPEGEVLLAIEGFALTANNVTYAATGEVIGYWNFFPTSDPQTGIVPVWGFARVIESHSPHLTIGDRLYGFLPMASHMQMRPEPRGPSRIVDVTPHRADLPPVYNGYQRVSETMASDDALKSVFYPLLITSYLLFDFLEDNIWFDAQQIIIGSASSKTGLGLAKYLAEARPNGPKVIGLTSAKNQDFVNSLNACDQIVSYDNIVSEIENVPSVYVDMAGNANVRSALHHHLGENMRHSAAVGTSHWDKFEPTGDLPGARPRFFFAPAQIEKRRAEWGPGEIEKRLESAYQRVAQDSKAWMHIDIDNGLDRAVAVYLDLANGRVNPSTAHYIQP